MNSDFFCQLPALHFLPLFNMSNNYLCLLGAIDNLWFHQTILFPEPISLLGPKSTETPQDSTANSSFTYPNSSSMVSLAVADEEVSSNFSTMLEPEIPSPGTPDSPEMSTPQVKPLYQLVLSEMVSIYSL